LTDKYKARPAEKDSLHPRNKHRERYNFEQLIKSCPELKPFVAPNKFNDLSVDFSDPDAVKMLNRALLQHFYEVKHWDIPEGYLCPPIPGRADYVHYMADLLASSNQGAIPQGKHIKALDIGVGANCVYPIIGHHEYGWDFVGTEVDPVAVASAKQIVADDPGLVDAVEIRQQLNPSNIYYDMIKPDEVFDVAFCNPPFHASMQEAEQGANRKLNNLGKATAAPKSVLNFGGQNKELWYPGGEAAFASKMIYQSSKMPFQCFWYSTLVSKQDNLFAIYKALDKVGAFKVETIKMAQGQKQSRVVAWTFLDNEKQKEWAARRWNSPLIP
jgi:23S rRNA (adenine1618-N6)-methyltransferase